MAYGKQQLKELSQKLAGIRERISSELPEYWWLSQGEEAIVSVRRLSKNKKLEISEMPKLTLRVALKVLIDNINVIEQLSGVEFHRALSVLEEDLSRVAEAYKTIQDAHSIVEEIESVRKLLRQKKSYPTKGQEIERELDTLIKWIRDLIVGNFYDWNSKKEKVELLLSKIKEHVQNL